MKNDNLIFPYGLGIDLCVSTCLNAMHISGQDERGGNTGNFLNGRKHSDNSLTHENVHLISLMNLWRLSEIKKFFK
jgi:hypothetical protein